MFLSLAVILLGGLGAGALFKRLRLPSIVGMLLVGVLAGPCALGLLDESILAISADLRKIALVIILLKAGLSLNLADLKRVGRPAVLMSCVPAACEIAGYVLTAPLFLGISRVEAAVMGAVLAAVSPAVVVPRMVRLMEEGYGTDKSIPQLVLAGASCDDIFVIALFTSFLGMAQGEGVRAAGRASQTAAARASGAAGTAGLLDIPVSIALGVIAGALCGVLLAALFTAEYNRGRYIRNSAKLIIILGAAFLLLSAEELLKPYVALSGLLAVVSMACVIKLRCPECVTQRLSQKSGKLWIAAEAVLFVLVGAAVDVRYMAGAGLSAAALILTALLFRSAGVMLCLIKTPLSARERLFCVLAYLPKATVQAAIGSVPLAAGLACGNIVLTVAVLGIVITAPLGAFLIDFTYGRLLTRSPKEE